MKTWIAKYYGCVNGRDFTEKEYVVVAESESAASELIMAECPDTEVNDWNILDVHGDEAGVHYICHKEVADRRITELEDAMADKMTSPETVKCILETPYWQPTLRVETQYVRQHDDHDGNPRGGLAVTFDRCGDAYISTDHHNSLRFRTYGGGGQSEHTRAALMILAEAIRLDNEQSPQHFGPTTGETQA